MKTKHATRWWNKKLVFSTDTLRCCMMLLASGLFFTALVPYGKADTALTFQLARTAHTSAAVYNSSGKLVRTLWSDALITGTAPFTAFWDNKDDYGNTVSADTYTIKVLGHNVNYVWEGVAGNTSDNMSGSTVHACMHFATTISFSGTTGCYSVGYSENSPCFYSFLTSTPQQLTQRFTGCTGGGNNYNWRYSDADSTQVFFACRATESGTNVLNQPGAVTKFNPVTGTNVAFTSGTTIYEQYHPFTNGVKVGTQPSITGLAVQKNGGTLLAVSVAADNLVYLLDKTSGSVVRSFAVTLPGPMAMDNNDNLWVVSGTSNYQVYQYSNLGSTPTVTGTVSASGTNALVKPLALGVSPSTALQPNLLVIADGGTSQQIKAFNMSGAWQWTFGQAGGFASDPTVTTDKFWFYNTELEREQTSTFGGEQTAVAFQPDGTFWVVDNMNCRMLHYQLGATGGASPVYQNQISFLNASYSNAIDPNNPGRAFISPVGGKWLEYRIDYSKTLSGTNGSWTLIKNWGYPVTSGTSYIGWAGEGLKGVTTLSNGRTYALVLNRNNSKSVVELPATGNLRFTGITTSAAFIYADGSLRYQTLSGSTSTFSKQTLTGFDGSYNPIWSGTTTIATAPAVSGTDPTHGGSSGGPRLPITSSNKLVFFDNERRPGMHLGGIDLNGSTTTWAWEAAPTTGYGESSDPQVPLWGDGSFDSFPGVNYPGGLHDAIGRNILYQYKGENWNASEANQLMHFYDDGLFVGQFGTPNGGPLPVPPGAAGNMMMGMLTATNGKTYFYTNDENQHSGYHRWRLDGLGTIAELAGSGTLNSTITLAGTAPINNDPTKTSVPGAITGLQASPSNSGCNFLQWTGTNAVYYQVRRSATPNNGYQIIATGHFQTCFIDSDVTNGTTYYYTVTAVNGNGTGSTTREVVATSNTAGNVYEAELGTLSGVTARANKVASAKNEVANTTTGSITINNINGGMTSGTCALVIRYRWWYGTWTGAGLTVNGTAVTLPAFPQTPSDGSFADYTVNIPLNSGTNNTLVLSKSPIIDKFTVMADTPFQGTPWIIPDTGFVKIEVENYDMGGEGKAYHDTASTSGIPYRGLDTVGVSNNSTASNGYHVGNCSGNEWLKYTVSVPTTGAYTFTIYAATPSTGATLHVEDELGNNLTGTMTITNTGNWNTFAGNSVTVNLTAGTHTLKVVENSGGYNLDYFTISH